MSTPLQFYRTFKGLMEEHRIRHVLTSGMACVEYGLQQTTKDTDWIIEQEDIPRLVELLIKMDQTHFRVRYRQFFGAPLLSGFLAGGWTSHILLQNSGATFENHVDLFGYPPRVQPGSWCRDYGGCLNLSDLCLMKKTDRRKDWPYVNALAMQALERGDLLGLMHLRDIDLLKKYAREVESQQLAELAASRPLLLEVQRRDSMELERLLQIEESLWASINRDRYQTYQKEWKEFYHRWSKDTPGAWSKNDQPFFQQHEMLVTAVERYGLPRAPFDAEDSRKAAYHRAILRSTALNRATDEEITLVLPPLHVMFP